MNSGNDVDLGDAQHRFQTDKKKDKLKRCVLIIEDHMVSPNDYEAAMPYAFIVAKNANEGLLLLKYGYKCIDAIVINDDMVNLSGVIQFIKNKYPYLPQLIMTGNKTYEKPYCKDELITIIPPPFDMASIRNGLRDVFR